MENKLSSKGKWKKGEKESLEKFRSNGNLNRGDFIYGSISVTDLDNETIVGLQEKLLFVLEVLQKC